MPGANWETHNDCCGSSRQKAKRSGDVNGTDRYMQTGVGDR